MGRKPDLDRIEPDRKRKRITVAVSARDAAAITKISALVGKTSTHMVGYMIGGGMEIEQYGRFMLDRPTWPPHPKEPRYVQAAFHPLCFLTLIDLAETAREPLNVTASALFKLGLTEYQEEHSPKAAVEEFDFG
jgi:hypothetical protein